MHKQCNHDDDDDGSDLSAAPRAAAVMDKSFEMSDMFSGSEIEEGLTFCAWKQTLPYPLYFLRSEEK